MGPVIIEPLPQDDGGGFVALVPDLPGCMSDGETAITPPRCGGVTQLRTSFAAPVGESSAVAS
jgi:hypothetical protein